MAFGLLVVASTVRFLARGWVGSLYLAPEHHLTYPGFDWVAPLPGVGAYLHVAVVESRHLCDIELGERSPKVLALAQDRQPRQPRLEPLQAQLLEQPPIVVDRPPPLVIVIGDVIGEVAGPPAPGAAVVPDDEPIGHLATPAPSR